MWTFKSKPTVTVKDAYNKLLPVRYEGNDVAVIEHHGKGYGPQSLGDMPDCFRILFEKDGEIDEIMLSENEALELSKSSAPVKTRDCRK